MRRNAAECGRLKMQCTGKTAEVLGRSGGGTPETELAEGEGFEPPVPLRVRLISSQVPSTTQPPFRDSFLLGFSLSLGNSDLPLACILLYTAQVLSTPQKVTLQPKREAAHDPDFGETQPFKYSTFSPGCVES